MLAQNPCGVDAALLSVNNTVKLSLSQPHLFYVERSAQGIIFFVSIYCVCSCTYNMLQRSVTPPMHPISINGFYVQIVLAMVVPKSLFHFKPPSPFQHEQETIVNSLFSLIYNYVLFSPESTFKTTSGFSCNKIF